MDALHILAFALLVYFFFLWKKLRLCILLLPDVDPRMPLVSSNIMEGSDIQECVSL